jgi:hypothetical protein
MRSRVSCVVRKTGRPRLFSTEFEPTIEEQDALATFVVESVVDDATGRSDGDRCVGEPPAARYFLSSLAPADVDLAAGKIKKGRTAPTSAGFEFEVDTVPADLMISACASVYHRVWPTLDEQLDYAGGADEPAERVGRRYRLAPVFVRAEVDVGELRYRVPEGNEIASIGGPEFDDRFAAIRAQAASDPEIYLREAPVVREVPGDVLVSDESFTAWRRSQKGNAVVPEWHAHVSVAVRPSPSGNRRVTVLLENRSLDPTVTVQRRGEDSTRHDDDRDHFLFRIGLEVRCAGGHITPIEMNLGPDAYRYDGRLPAYASNCGVDYTAAPDGSVELIRAVPAPVHETYRVPSKDHPALRFANLIDDPIPPLEQIASALEAYASDPDWSTTGMSAEHARRKDADRRAFELEVARFKDGVAWIRKDPRLALAFRLANRSMIRLNDRSKRAIPGWRLFQLVFIVSQLSSLAWREHPEGEFAVGLWGDETGRDPTDAATVLWFPTGGGKTEAYLGLIACALFFDRCRGKTRGVTAWCRFPLRLLSLQQTQRHLALVVAADEIREEAKQEIEAAGGELGDRFAIGFYVGEGNSPNSLSRDDNVLERLRSDGERRREARIVDECPYCGVRAVEVMPPDRRLLRLVHACTACGRDLPLFVVDTEVYRYLPSVILGTIDKLAMIGLSDRFSALLGDVDCACDLHGFGRGMKCHERRVKQHPKDAVKPLSAPLYDPAPSLEVLDELHMIREELGVFAGHYEGILAVIQRQLSARQRGDGRGIRMKVIATSATIKGEDRQCEHLFGLRSVVVPLPGPTLDGSFYWSVDRTTPARRFVGVMPHRLTAEMTLVRILQAFHRAVRRLESDGTAASPVVAGIDPTRMPGLIDLYRVSLTYVTSLVDFGKLRRSMDTQVNEYLRRIGVRDIEVSELSGDTSFDEVRETLDDLDSAGSTEAIVATSMISHGVDIGRMNVMVFNGMPKSIAEYIQASSRVGRNFLGVVFMIFNPIRERDRSHSRYHAKFHEYLDRMVEPVAINRWSRYAARKTIPGVLMALILQSVNRDYWESGRHPHHLHDLTRMQEALRPPDLGGLSAAQKAELLASLEKAYLTDWDGARELLAELDGRLDTALSSIRAAGAGAGAARGAGPRYRGTGDYLGLEYDPMSSLRDVAEGLPFYILQDRRRS